jgi:ATP-binding cassette subfamily C protein
VAAIARKSHVRTRSVELPDGWWRRAGDPLLGFREADGRPLALIPRDAGYVWLDAERGESGRVDATLHATLESAAVAFQPPVAEESRSAMGLVRFALKGRRTDLADVLWPALAATVASLATPHATALLVDYAIPDARADVVLQRGAGILVCALGAAFFRASQSRAQLRFETHAEAVTQSALWDHALRLPLSALRRFASGDLRTRLAAVGRMRNQLGGAAVRIVFAVGLLLTQSMLLLYYSRRLALVAFLVAVCTATAMLVTGWRMVRHTRLLLEQRGRLFGLLVQLVQAVPKLRVAAAEERAFGRWAGDQAELASLELRRATLRDRLECWRVAISCVGLAVVLGMVTAQVSLSTGRILGFLAAYGIFSAAVASLTGTLVDLLASRESYRRLRPLLEEKPELDETRTDPGVLGGEISLHDVCFRYAADGPRVLDGVSLEIEPGSFVAVVGASGSGKSTLVKLLLGFERPEEGSVRYDGQDLASLDPTAVRRQLGVVLQDGRLGAGSILDFLAGGAAVTLDRARRACESAGVLEEIEALPMGFHTVLADSGSNVSGGQRQRLMIARALLHEPRILLLDEATSALDNRSQATVMRRLGELDLTRVVVAHRMSTVRDADRIVVLQDGRVAEQGTYDDLMATRGVLHRLVARSTAA